VKIEEVSSSEKVVDFKRSKRYRVPEDLNVYLV